MRWQRHALRCPQYPNTPPRHGEQLVIEDRVRYGRQRSEQRRSDSQQAPRGDRETERLETTDLHSRSINRWAGFKLLTALIRRKATRAETGQGHDPMKPSRAGSGEVKNVLISTTESCERRCGRSDRELVDEIFRVARHNEERRSAMRPRATKNWGDAMHACAPD